MSLLDRYLIRETSLTLLAVSFVLVFVIVARLFVRLLGDVTEGKLPADIIFPLVGLGALKSVILLLPLALLIAAMLTLGRWYRDSEMHAVRSSGVGFLRLYRPLMALALAVALVLLFLVMKVSPWSIQYRDQLREAARQRADITGITPGRFIEIDQGNLVLFSGGIRAHGGVSDVFIHRREDGRITIETARSARQAVDPASGDKQLVLKHGFRYRGAPGDHAYHLLAFKAHTIRLPGLGPIAPATGPETRSAKRLWASQSPPDNAELQWRLSVPLSALLLMLLALPLSKTTPRQGRFGKLTLAIVIYIVYANLVIASVSWIKREVLPPWIGVWWVHLLLLAGTGLLFVHQFGWRRLLRRPARRRLRA